MLLSSVCFAIMNLLVKYLAHFSTYELLFFRAIGSVLFAFIYLRKNQISMLGNSPKLLIIRSVVGLTSVGLFFASIPYLSIGTAVALRYTSPIFAAILAIFLLKEKIYKLQWLFFFMAFLGVLLIKGFEYSAQGIGFVLVILSAFFSGLVYVVISKIGNSEHPVVIINYFMGITAIFGGVFTIFNWSTPQGIEWLLLLSLGVFGYFGQLFMTKAYQIGVASTVVPLKYVEVVFTMLLGIVLIKDTYSLMAITGIFLVITGLILNIIFKTKINNKNTP